MVPVIELEPELVAVNEGTFPTPLAGIPIDGFEFVQLNVAPAGELLKLVATIDDPLQVERLSNGLTVGKGLTTTEVVPTKLVHPPTVTVTEYVPAANVDAATIVGFCNYDEKLFGPVQE